MPKATLKEFLERLLGRGLGKHSEFTLTSAQRARVIAWMQANGCFASQNEMRGILTLESLIAGVAESSSDINSSIDASLENLDSIANGFIKIGIDIQKISEFLQDGLPADPKSDLELLKIFTLQELSYSQTSESPADTLTGIFAAKEAIIKAGSSLNFRDIEVLPGDRGQPQAAGYSISISHSGDFAIAIAFSQSSFAQSSVCDSGTVDKIIESREKVSKFSCWRAVFDMLIVAAIMYLLWITS